MGVVRMDPVGFALYADQFLRAGQSVPGDGKFSPVPYYLFCRSLELILKAFLLTKGHKISELENRYRHDLVRLWNAAREGGLAEAVTPLPDIASDLAQANSYYHEKAFEYFDFRRWARKYQELPSLHRVESAAATLVASLKPYCLSVA
jgi:hypothetical protein